MLTAVRVLHAHGWTHRNITARTVLVCDDGRVVLTGLAAGAAEEALCGYAPLPGASATPDDPPGAPGEELSGPGAARGTGLSGPGSAVPGLTGPGSAGPGLPALDSAGPEYAGRDYTRPGPAGPEPYGRTAVGPAEPGPTAGVPSPERSAVESPYGLSSGTSGAMPRPQHGTPGIPAPFDGQPALPGSSASGDIRAARAGAIAAYRAGARAAARVTEDQQRSAERTGSLPVTQGTQGQGQGHGDTGPQDPHGPPHAPHGAQTSQEPSEPQGSRGPGGGDPDWWAQPPSAYTGPDDDADDGEDDDPPGPTPYRAELAGTWRDGPAPWNDSAGSLPAGGSPYGTRRRAARRCRPAATPGRARPWHAGASRPTQPRAPTAEAVPAAAEAGIPAARATRCAPTPSGSRAQLPPAGGHRRGRTVGRRRRERLPSPRTGAPPPRSPPSGPGRRGSRSSAPSPSGGRPSRPAPCTRTGSSRRPSAPPPTSGRSGALLYRAVQGHAPYPEESAVELVQLVCAEPPAFAEECGPLRPVVESLLRQDPTERPDFEELRGWLRSLVRSAPEPEAGPGRRAGAVRRRTAAHRAPPGRAGTQAPRWSARRTPPEPEQAGQGARGEGRTPRGRRSGRRRGAHGRGIRAAAYEAAGRRTGAARYGDDRSGGGYGDDRRPYRSTTWTTAGRPQRGPGGRAPRSLGRTLLVLILLLLVAAIAFAVMFMPKADPQKPGRSVGEATPAPGRAAPTPRPPGAVDDPGPAARTPARRRSPTPRPPHRRRPIPPSISPRAMSCARTPRASRSPSTRTGSGGPINDSGQVRYVRGDFTLIVVPGRDTVADNGADPMEYQRDKERELQPFRDSSWSTASGLRRIDVGQQAMAEGQFTWQDSSGREVYVRNLAVIIEGRYHVIQVIGPDGQRDQVSEIYQQATAAYRAPAETRRSRPHRRCVTVPFLSRPEVPCRAVRSVTCRQGTGRGTWNIRRERARSGAGQVLAGRYRLGETIGSGGMGKVWRAHDEVLHRTVAVKELTAGRYVSEADRAVLHQRTQKEARAAARITHPGRGDGARRARPRRPAVDRHAVRRRSLPRRRGARTRARIDWREAARIGLQVLGALRAAHAAGVLHRDVKPGNVLLARDGRVLLTDFGIAAIEGDSTITRTGELVGSIDYLAPERVRGSDPGPAVRPVVAGRHALHGGAGDLPVPPHLAAVHHAGRGHRGAAAPRTRRARSPR